MCLYLHSHPEPAFVTSRINYFFDARRLAETASAGRIASNANNHSSTRGAATHLRFLAVIQAAGDGQAATGYCVNPGDDGSSKFGDSGVLEQREARPSNAVSHEITENAFTDVSVFSADETWVKGDMVYPVGFHRLDLIRLGARDGNNKRAYFKSRLPSALMDAVFACVLHGLNLAGRSGKEKGPNGS